MAEHPCLVEEGLGEHLREVVEGRRRLVVEDKEVQERLRTLQEGLGLLNANGPTSGKVRTC